MRRPLLALLLATGCGSPNPGTDIDAPGIDPDAAVDGDGSLLVDAAPDAPGTMVDGPPAMACPAGTWCTETAPIAPTTRLFAVHARDSSDVWAVGDGGVIVRRLDDAWAVVPSGTTQNLRGVWAAGPNDAWAVGEGSTVIRWNGTAWSPVAGVLPISYTGVWGSGANDVWLIGTSRVQRWTGSAWATPVTIPGTLLSIHGTGPSDVWVAGEPTYLRHYTGSWSVVMPGGGSTQYVVEAIAANNVWTVAPGSGPRNFNGSTWTPYTTDSYVDLHAFSATNMWGVTGTKAGHWNGSTWTVTTPTGVTTSLWGVSGAGGHLWIVGSGAKILHRN